MKKKCISKEREGSRAGRRFGRSWPHALPFTGYFYRVHLHTFAQPWVPTHSVTTALVKLLNLPHWELSSLNANPTMVCGPEAYITLPWGPIILDISPYPCIPTLSSEVSAGFPHSFPHCSVWSHCLNEENLSVNSQTKHQSHLGEHHELALSHDII